MDTLDDTPEKALHYKPNSVFLAPGCLIYFSNDRNYFDLYSSIHKESLQEILRIIQELSGILVAVLNY